MFPQFDCGTCTDQLKGERGCERSAPFPYWTDLDGVERDRCPRRPIYEDVSWYNRLIGTYNGYKNGFMPHSGGLNEQACLYPQIMGIVDGTVQECDRIRMEQDRSKSGTGGSVSLLGKK